jgi:hypothetical protein
MKLKSFKTFGLVLLALAVLIGGITISGDSFASGYQPTGAKASSTQSKMRNSSPFANQFVMDFHYIWVPVTPMHFVVTSDGDITSTVKGVSAAAPITAEIGSSDITGITLDADAEDFSVMIPAPIGCDWAQASYVRVLYSESSSTVGSVLFALSYGEITVDSEAIAVAATTTGVTDGDADATSATGNALEWANWSTVAASTFSVQGGKDMLIFKFDVDLTTVTDSTVYGIQFKCAQKYVGGDNL